MSGHKSSTGSSPESNQSREMRNGVIFAASGYALWGITPLFWRLLDHIPVVEVLLHRIIWAVPLLAVWLFVRGRLRSAFAALTTSKTMLMLVTSALLVSVNWGIFIWAVSQERILEASLGYYINPLMNVVIGYVLLNEKLSKGQLIAIGLAVIAIIIQIWSLGSLPWVSLSLAITFAFYGYFKKKTSNIGAAQGLFIEVLLVAPFALAGIIWLQWHGQSHFQLDVSFDALLLVAAGLVTVVPLVLFAAGARRIQLITIGLLQYIGPSINLCLAIFVFNETAQSSQIFSFVLIWTGLVIFSYDAYKTERNRTMQRPSNLV